MASVAIIHAGEDTMPARALAQKLREANLTVLLEKASGEEIRAAAKESKVTIALWSPRSVGQQPLIDDAAAVRGKTNLVHATMQNAAAPDSFKKDKTVNLTGWRGEDDFAAWRELADIVTKGAGVAPLPPPAPRPPSGFFQPGIVRESAQAAAPAAGGAPARAAPPPPRPAQARPAPPPRPQTQQQNFTPAPEREGGGGGKGLIIGAIAFVVVALAGGGGYYFWSQSHTAAATSAWDSVAQNDADALRAFLAGDPGEYREQAQTALAALEERTFEAASDADTIEAFEAFLNDFPESQHAIAVRGRIAELRTMTPAQETPAEALPQETTDPDLLPPGTATTPPAGGGGPATLTPPTPEEIPSIEPGAPEN